MIKIFFNKFAKINFDRVSIRKMKETLGFRTIVPFLIHEMSTIIVAIIVKKLVFSPF